MQFYDHAKNHASAAQASAVARARRTAIDEGQAYRVEFDASKYRCYWDGCRYDAIGLAKNLFFNRFENVKLLNPAGKEVDIAAAKY